LTKLREYTSLLKKLGNESKQRFVSDPFIYGNVERYLQLAIQSILDIGNHIISEKKLGNPGEYREIIELLGEHNIISSDLMEKLLPLAGLRNILVHDYIDVDRERLYNSLNKELSDFEEFAKLIGRLL